MAKLDDDYHGVFDRYGDNRDDLNWCVLKQLGQPGSLPKRAEHDQSLIQANPPKTARFSIEAHTWLLLTRGPRAVPYLASKGKYRYCLADAMFILCFSSRTCDEIGEVSIKFGRWLAGLGLVWPQVARCCWVGTGPAARHCARSSCSAVKSARCVLECFAAAAAAHMEPSQLPSQAAPLGGGGCPRLSNL